MNIKTIHIPLPLRLILFWLVHFAIFRMAFVLLLFNRLPAEELKGWGAVFYHGLKLDLATTGYMLVLPLAIGGTALFTGKGWMWKTARVLQSAQMIVVGIIATGNLAIYRAWGTLLNYRAVQFLQDPEGIIASLSNWQLLLLALGLTALCILLTWISSRLLIPAESLSKDQQQRWLVPVFFILTPMMMRGGWQQIPVNESSAFHTEKAPLNHAATNPVWYLGNNWIKSAGNHREAYTYMQDETAKGIFDNLMELKGEPMRILTLYRPNIVLIVLESWSADFIGPLQGDPTATPFFNSLCDSGLLFTGIYSSGRRTDQMFPSVLSGYPAQPNHSISRYTDKIQRLPMLPEELERAGYSTLFHYGGELGFGNMNSFLLQAGFSSITGKDRFNDEQMGSKWGAHDEHLFEKQLEDINRAQPPFFSMGLTLSSHEPFDVPGNGNKKPAGERERFHDAVRYTDRCLKQFMESASRQKWYAQTLFILVADHGHHTPARRDYHDPSCYRIPLLFYGEVIKPEVRGRKLSKTGSQHDLPPTLLNQLGIQTGKFVFSKDLFNEKHTAFAYLNFDDAFGYVSDSSHFVYLFEEKRMLDEYTNLKENQDSTLARSGKAYMQMLYKDFLMK